jgi:nucleotidyltransferase/DNA polymerase involved in DNA repair
MDAFFAQIEQRDHPEYRKKALIVGGPLFRGVISSASYEARVYGLYAGMPLYKARQLCPNGIYLPVDMEKYLKVSRQIRDIFCDFTPLVEVVGCDEAFLDVTGARNLFGLPVEIAKKIKNRIFEKTKLTCSAGISHNKFLAKLASGLEKPDGLVILTKENVKEKLEKLPVTMLWGVGRVTQNELKRMGIETIGELAKIPVEVLTAAFGKLGKFIHNLANGIDDDKVIPFSPSKSISRETTFAEDTNDLDRLKTALLKLSERVAMNLRREGYRAVTINLKLKFSDFKIITRSITLKHVTCLGTEIYSEALKLIKKNLPVGRRVRLIGVGVSNLKGYQVKELSLFEGNNKDLKLAEAVDDLITRHGKSKVIRASMLKIID